MGLLATLLGHATDVTPEETREDLEGILLPDEPVEVAFRSSATFSCSPINA
jgi:hypothetical protein